MKEMIILRGQPGAGKSSLAALLKSLKPSAVICSADDALINQDGVYEWSTERVKMAHRYCKDTAILACKCNVEMVIIDNTNKKKRDYEWYMNLGTKYGYTIRLISIENTHGNKSIHF